MKVEDWRTRLLIASAYRIFQLWARTLRFEIDDRAGIVGVPPSGRFIATVWHNRLFLFPYVVRRFLPETQGAALVSASRDGAILAEVLKRFHFGAVRGSSSRRGATALLELAEVIARGGEAAITPDGPRGPAYELGPGIIVLAQKSGADVLPMNVEFSSYWRLKTWDRFIIPKPFSKVRVIFDQRYQVRATQTDAEFEAERLRLQETMMSLVQMR
ncbi:MAG: lysophospholipid acyltransferase family protein [Chthoniobacterales bacterium]